MRGWERRKGRWGGVGGPKPTSIYICKFFILSLLQSFYKTAHNLGKNIVIRNGLEDGLEGSLDRVLFAADFGI